MQLFAHSVQEMFFQKRIKSLQSRDDTFYQNSDGPSTHPHAPSILIWIFYQDISYYVQIFHCIVQGSEQNSFILGS